MAATPAAEEAHRALDDTELLRRIGHGEGHGSQSAFRELVNRHSRYLYGVAYSLTQNGADADDIVQETFVAVLTSRFRGESSARTWLVQILVRRAAMLRRSRKRATVSGPTLPIEAAATDPTVSASRASGIAGTEARLDLAVMLEALSPEHRQVIVLREVEGMTYEEMAAALHLPRGTVESRLHRARMELRERFKGYLNKS